jgi:acetoin utilization protein AcuC
MASVVYHPAYRTYSFGPDHPFDPVRVDMVLDLLAELGHEVRPVAPEPAGRADILAVHEEYYVRRVEELSCGKDVPDSHAYGLGTPDTPAFRGMDEAARWHVGGTLEGARRIFEEGEKRVLQLGGGMHHARRNFASGFCVYNDLAAAIQLLARRGLWVGYIDLDVHHGDGVQQILYEDRRVLTISLHEEGQYLFPGTGGINELGAGLGRGLKLNVPLEPLTTGESYREVFEEVVPTALHRFRPDVLVVQAGADAHFDDPLGDLLLTTSDFVAIFRRILEWAEELTKGRVLFTLGGGYSLPACSRIWSALTLLLLDLPVPNQVPETWATRWARILGEGASRDFFEAAPPSANDPRAGEIARRNREVARRLLESASAYWF